MRHYLATLHKRSDHYKKQFTLFVSGSITVLIFVIWALVTFGNGGTMAESNIENQRAHKEVTPLETLIGGVKESLGAINQSVQELKSEALNIYGPVRSNEWYEKGKTYYDSYEH